MLVDLPLQFFNDFGLPLNGLLVILVLGFDGTELTVDAESI